MRKITVNRARSPLTPTRLVRYSAINWLCASSAKAKALAADPRACLIVDLEEPPYAYVRIDAEATILDDPALTLRVATEVGRRYMGEELAEAFGRRNSSAGQVTVEFRPSKVTAIHDISD